MNIINTAGTVPIPNHKIENGIHATGGIGLKILITKVAISSKVLYHPSSIPKGIAIIEASIKPANTLNNVSIVFVKSFPFSITTHAEFKTSKGPGKIYEENNPIPLVITYQNNIKIIGRIKGTNLFL
jgi:hypothetical protein